MEPLEPLTTEGKLRVDTEALIARDPRTIVLAYPASSGNDEQKAMQAFMALPGRLSAVRDHRVITLDDIYLVSHPDAGVDGLLYDELRALR
jgi:ABC-type Fe3+-hydroxamate transport system substrate-binding protein